MIFRKTGSTTRSRTDYRDSISPYVAELENIQRDARSCGRRLIALQNQLSGSRRPKNLYGLPSLYGDKKNTLNDTTTLFKRRWREAERAAKINRIDQEIGLYNPRLLNDTRTSVRFNDALQFSQRRS